MNRLRWVKRGVVYCVDERLPWARSHAQIPTIESVNPESLSVLFSSRDSANRSMIAKIELDPHSPSRILCVYPQPILPLGKLGAFDDCGMMPSSVVDWRGDRYLYYIGWNVRNTVPYHNSVGLAVSSDGGKSYRRMFDGPVMDRTAEEPYFCATTCIRIENGIWRNWYLSCTGWQMVEGYPEPRYHLKYAESVDGIHWRRDGRVAIDYADASEGGIVRASVVKDGSAYRMWYCYRGLAGYRGNRTASYRIGYAESDDGLDWKRMDDFAGIDPSDEGWDSFMVAYPEVVKMGEQYCLFYNGNGFGETGFGYALAVSS